MGHAFAAVNPKASQLNRHYIAWEDTSGYYLASFGGDEKVRGTECVNVRTTSDDKSMSLEAWMKSDGELTEIHQRPLSVNEYHPRIYRPGAQEAIYRYQPGTVIEQSAVAIEVLLDRMQQLFRVVEPDATNLAVFGHEIRNLLLLACMEVEASWAAVLNANTYPHSRMTTKDYVKLCGPLHLAEYGLMLTSYPMFPPMRPFFGWDQSNPTVSLPWYDAYNRTKHNREKHFSAATLENALNAVAGAVIMFFAQFGRCDVEHDWAFLPRWPLFQIHGRPSFLADEWYLLCANGQLITGVKYPF